MKKITYDPSICSGCLACVVNCSQYNEAHSSLESARIKIEIKPFSEEHTAFFCRQCKNAPCAKECSKKAIKFDLKGNFYKIDYSLCDGCQACIKVCPFKAIFFDSITNKIIKCDTCKGDPVCVTSCYTNALKWN